MPWSASFISARRFFRLCTSSRSGARSMRKIPGSRRASMPPSSNQNASRGRVYATPARSPPCCRGCRTRSRKSTKCSAVTPSPTASNRTGRRCRRWCNTWSTSISSRRRCRSRSCSCRSRVRAETKNHLSPPCGERETQASFRILLQNPRNHRNLIARVFRQAGADRVAGVERRLAHQHLRRHQVAQHRDVFIIALLVEHAGLDRERHERGDHGLACVARVVLEHRQKLAELHDLVDVEKVLLDH